MSIFFHSCFKKVVVVALGLGFLFSEAGILMPRLHYNSNIKFHLPLLHLNSSYIHIFIFNLYYSGVLILFCLFLVQPPCSPLASSRQPCNSFDLMFHISSPHSLDVLLQSLGISISDITSRLSPLGCPVWTHTSSDH